MSGNQESKKTGKSIGVKKIFGIFPVSGILELNQFHKPWQVKNRKASGVFFRLLFDSCVVVAPQEGVEPPTSAFRFVLVSQLPGLSLRHGSTLGGSHLVSTPS